MNPIGITSHSFDGSVRYISSKKVNRRSTVQIVMLVSLFWITLNGFLLFFIAENLSNKRENSRQFKGSESENIQHPILRDEQHSNKLIGEESILIEDIETGSHKFSKKEDEKDSLVSHESINLKAHSDKPKQEDKVDKKQVAHSYASFAIDFSYSITNPPNWPGEFGSKVVLSNDLVELAQNRYSENQFNVVASELVALNRSVPTLPQRMYRNCIEKKYPFDLPTTSIVIVLHNEANSTLLRGLTSLVNRSPSQYLKEIIIVDDASNNREYLNEPLIEHVKSFPIPFTIIHNKERLGLIKSRLVGASVAIGETLTFLDAHIEANVGWLPPLLYEVKLNRRTIVSPVIDVISDDDFSYALASTGLVGGFEDSLEFNWFDLDEEKLKLHRFDRSAPIKTPTIAGGLFTVDKKYFYEIGSYDEGMEIWGSENIEISFRVWMCGGQLLIHPCSRVGHVFRKSSPYTFPGGADHIIKKNIKRVVDVWTDEFKEYFYRLSPQMASIDAGDITSRVELRRKLKCKSFRWYLNNVYPSAPVPFDAIHVGEIANVNMNLCLDSLSSDFPGTEFCHHKISISQMFIYDKFNMIKNNHKCLDIDKVSLPIRVKFNECNNSAMSQRWVYNTKTLKFTNQETKSCLTINKLNQRALVLTTCEKDNNNNLKIWKLNRPLFKK